MSDYKLGFSGAEIDAMLSQISALQNQMDTLVSDIASVNTQISNLTTDVQTLASYGNTGIKKIQRGLVESSPTAGQKTGTTETVYYNGTSGTNRYYYDITIDSVNTAKSFILVSKAANYNSYTDAIAATFINSSTIRVYWSGYNQANFEWQVVEFN